MKRVLLDSPLSSTVRSLQLRLRCLQTLMLRHGLRPSSRFAYAVDTCFFLSALFMGYAATAGILKIK